MSANIDSMIYIGEKPWHNEGRLVEQPKSAASLSLLVSLTGPWLPYLSLPNAILTLRATMRYTERTMTVCLH